MPEAERIVFVREAKDGLGRQNGVRAGDVIVAVNGQKVGDHEEAKDLIRMAGLEVRLVPVTARDPSLGGPSLGDPEDDEGGDARATTKEKRSMAASLRCQILLTRRNWQFGRTRCAACAPSFSATKTWMWKQ